MSIRFMHNLSALMLIGISILLLMLGYDYLTIGQGLNPLFAGCMSILSSVLAGLLFTK